MFIIYDDAVVSTQLNSIREIQFLIISTNNNDNNDEGVL